MLKSLLVKVRPIVGALLVLMAAMVAIPLLLVRPLPRFAMPGVANIDILFAMLWLIGAACAVGAAWQAMPKALAAACICRSLVHTVANPCSTAHARCSASAERRCNRGPAAP